jgi:hypothetical protein
MQNETKITLIFLEYDGIRVRPTPLI